MDKFMPWNKKKHHHHNHRHSHYHHEKPPVQPRQRPLDASELYQLEHKPVVLAKLPSDNEDDRAQTGRTKPLAQQYYYPPCIEKEGIEYEENPDAEAEEFIAFEHQRFELSKWMSVNPY